MPYKLTDENLRAHNGYQWTLGEWHHATGMGDELCSNGWLHGYSDPLLALFMNPIHANITNPRLFRCEVAGDVLDDRGLKFGAKSMRLVEELPVPVVTMEQCVRFGILVCLELQAVTGLNLGDEWNRWAARWLDGTDRSHGAARVAEAAAAEGRAAAAWAAAADAAWVAAWAAAAGRAAAWATAAATARIDLVACAHEAMVG